MDVLKDNEYLKLIILIADCITYFYPGIISLWAFNFFRGDTLPENKVTIIKSVVISYIYIKLIGIPVHEYGPGNHVCLILWSFLAAFALALVLRSKPFVAILEKLNIRTSFSSNLIEYALSLEGSLRVRAYMDEYGIMYEGNLRAYEHEMTEDKNQDIMLSSYIIYKRGDNGYTRSTMENPDNRDWVVLQRSSINRLEIVFKNGH